MTLCKKPIVWHEDGLKNMKSYLERELFALKHQQLKIKELQQSIEKREKQIAHAKKKGWTEFDEQSKVLKNL
jgi:hypothetical protein